MKKTLTNALYQSILCKNKFLITSSIYEQKVLFIAHQIEWNVYYHMSGVGPGAPARFRRFLL